MQRTDFYNESSASTSDIRLQDLPENNALDLLATGIGRAWELYGIPRFVVQLNVILILINLVL